MTTNNRVRHYEQRSRWRNRLMQIMNGEPDNLSPGEVNVGRRLQELRLMRGLSQRALAEMSGLNFNTLSLIENEKTSPNVSTLQQLATALNVPITAFFEVMTPYQVVVYQKSGHRKQTPFPQGNFEDLGGGLALGEATPLLMTLYPGEESDPTPIVHTGQEFVYCLEGKIAFWVGDQTYILESGDSLIFEAHIPHRWENRHTAQSKSVLVISPSDRDDRSVSQHLMKRPSF